MGQDLPVTSYALLGLLTFGDELTGYELKQRADMTLRFYWVAPAMSQIYTEVARLTERGLLGAATDSGTTRYRITEAGQGALRDWLTGTPAGFPVLKHPVALRLLIAHASTPEQTRAMLEEYVEQVTAARADLVVVRESLRGADSPGAAFRNPALVAEWGLAYYDSEKDIALRMLEELARE